MKLSQKRNCNGCTADGKDCELGYNRTFIPKKGLVPLQPCLKPLTNKQYLQAMDMPREEKYED